MVTQNPPSYATPAETAWNVHTEGKIKHRLTEIELPFDIQPSTLVLDRIKMYVTAGRRDTEAILGRSVLYFPIFEHYLRLYNLPDELKYLPIIESGLNPDIRSHVGAVGMWQFMHATARHYDMTINEYIDERRDPYRSTEAAVRLLSDLYDRFGDWALVLSAYNGGLGRVQKAIDYAGSKDYQKVKDYLPRETQRYVPYFVAATYVAKHYENHGLTPRLPAYKLQHTRVIEVHQYLSFSEIAQVTGEDYATISSLNPGYLRGAVPRSSKGCYLVLPSESVAAFKQYLAKKTDQNLSNLIPPDSFKYSYIVQTGDNLESLARTFQCSVEDIKTWNHLSGSKVVVNQEIDLYLSKAFIFNRA